MKTRYIDRFQISEKVCIVTGGGGLIGKKHTEAIIEGGGIPVLLDIAASGMERVEKEIRDEYGDDVAIEKYVTDITNREAVSVVRNDLMGKYGHIDVLINNAANNPKVEDKSKNLLFNSFSQFPVEIWNQDIAVGLTGALICSQIFGEQMGKQGKGIILNISSDYGLIAPDQRIYKRDGVPEEEQIIKPVSYSVIKHGMIGLTKYLAVYWANKGIRVNTLCPASLENGQDDEFVKKLSNLIPMQRMSNPDEYVCTILYMISEASSYMTGATVVLDGGRTAW